MTRICERMDCHSHSAYSGHGSGSVEDMVRRAEELGLAVFAQTEHLVLPEGMDPGFETSMSSQTMKRYIEELHEQRERLAHVGSGMQLICGIEADWLPGRTDELTELCKPFEYVLGSVHFIDNRPIDDSRDLSVWGRLWRRWPLAGLFRVLARHGGTSRPHHVLCAPRSAKEIRMASEFRCEGVQLRDGTGGCACRAHG